jgi:hypothetical protein
MQMGYIYNPETFKSYLSLLGFNVMSFDKLVIILNILNKSICFHHVNGRAFMNNGKR